MEIVLSILFIIVMCAWIGYHEMGATFLGIHIKDILTEGTFCCIMTVALLVSMIIILMFNSTTASFNVHEIFVITTAVVITVALMTCAKLSSSAILALWGAVAAVANSSETLNTYPIIQAVTSLLGAPAVALLLYIIYKTTFDSNIHSRDMHLLLKNLHMKRLALAGIILAAIALGVNYGLLLLPFFSSIAPHVALSPSTLITVVVAITASLAAITVVMLIKRDHARLNPMRQSLPSIYSQLSTLLLCNIVATPLLMGSLAIPVVVSPKQLRACLRLTSVSNRHRNIVKLLCITIVSPLLTFLVAMALLSLVKTTMLMAVIATAILLISVLVVLFSKQYRSHNLVKAALRDEISHKSETGDERNRLDMAAATSHFNVMTNEIDIKHKELVNLSLYIKQQRQYLEDLSNQLLELSQSGDDAQSIREQLRLTALKLNENMKFTGEMDQFYTQVEELHKNFVSRLLMRCPSLSEKDKRLAILLRLGFSSKDISGMLNVEPKSVEVSRYRFRRKLRLDRSVNIVQYLQMI